jgi:PAS domain S-box-containing protein
MRIDQALMSSETREGAVGVLLLMGPDGSILDANPGALDCYGYSHAEMLALNLRDIRGPESQDDIDIELREASRHRVLFEVEARRSDGTLFPAEVLRIPVSVNGEPALLSFVRDITDLEQAQRVLVEHEDRYRAILQTAMDGFWLTDTDGRLLEVNEAYSRMSGYSEAELLTMRISDLEAIETAADTVSRTRTVTQQGHDRFESQHRRKDGSLFDVEVSVQYRPIEGGRFTSFFRDITERKTAESQLLALSVRNEAILDAVPDIIAEVDADKVYTWVNGAGRQFFGDDVLGHEAADYFLGEQETYSRVGPLFEGSTDTIYVESWQRRRDGEKRLIGWTCRALTDENGASTGALSTARDLTERKRAEEEILRLNAELEERVLERTEELHASNEELQAANERLGEANRELEQATRAKSEFLAAMSHELRTPLNSIIGFSGTMLQGLAGDINPEQQRQLEMINKSGRHLLELINEVLDLVRIESGQSAPAIGTVDPGSITREMLNTVRPMAEAKGIELRLTCPDSLAPIWTDGQYVTQILLNLLGNAVKFTERGYVSATVSQDGSGVAIAIEDSGCGISADNLEHIFDDFYQVVPHSSATGEGTGLGLAVCHRLAESIGARIEATSELGHGSVFTLRIPGRSRSRAQDS